MNFDEIKKKWDQQSIDNINIDVDLNKSSSINQLLYEVKSEHKKGLIMRCIALLWLFIFPLLLEEVLAGSILLFYYFFLTYFIISTLYNIIRYLQFVRSIGEFEDLASYNFLTKVYYSYKYYRDTSILVAIIDTPSGIGLLFIMLAREDTALYFNKLLGLSDEQSSIPTAIIMTIIASLIIVIIMVYWLHQKYDGKKLKAIKEVLDEFDN